MRDIFDAVEQHSATLALTVCQLARARGWGARTVSGMLIQPRLMMIHAASVLLPYGRAASFQPATGPRLDGDTWVIEVRRSDGVSRPEWNRNITVRRRGADYGLMFDQHPLDAPALEAMLEAIACP